MYFEAGFSPAKTLNDNYYEDMLMNCTRFTISTIGLKHEFTKSPVFFDAGLHELTRFIFISFNETDQYFISSCACAYFQVAVDVYTDLRYNQEEWE